MARRSRSLKNVVGPPIPRFKGEFKRKLSGLIGDLLVFKYSGAEEAKAAGHKEPGYYFAFCIPGLLEADAESVLRDLSPVTCDNEGL